MKTKVIFRKWRDNQEVIAIFPELPGSNAYNCTSYMHIGQHSSCSVDLTPYTTPATIQEYTPLKQELENIGYNLKVVKKVNSRSGENFDVLLNLIAIHKEFVMNHALSIYKEKRIRSETLQILKHKLMNKIEALLHSDDFEIENYINKVIEKSLDPYSMANLILKKIKF